VKHFFTATSWFKEGLDRLGDAWRAVDGDCEKNAGKKRRIFQASFSARDICLGAPHTFGERLLR
jgi:hypothetical protein